MLSWPPIHMVVAHDVFTRAPAIRLYVLLLFIGICECCCPLVLAASFNDPHFSFCPRDDHDYVCLGMCCLRILWEGSQGRNLGGAG